MNNKGASNMPNPQSPAAPATQFITRLPDGLTDYACVCHVCGALHTVRGHFASFACMWRVAGVERGVSACSHHTGAEIRSAYAGGKYPLLRQAVS